MSTYVVGDIQGCYQEFVQLLDTVNFEPASDCLWIAGDMINRGPDNLSTLNLLRELPNVQIVLGNHDLHFLALATTDRVPSKADTLTDLFTSDELPDIVAWMRQQHLAVFSESFDVLMVHAGIPHTWSIALALGLAAEVEAVIQGQDHQQFFANMYGNEPVVLRPELSGIERWRVITNCLTRMRFCDSNGCLELTTKTDVAPPGYSPWFEFPRTEQTRILFGHWAAIEGKTSSEQFVALDTGCVWGRRLTALRLDDNKQFSVPAQSGR